MITSPRCCVRLLGGTVSRRLHLLPKSSKSTQPSDPPQLSNPKLQTLIRSHFPPSQFCFAYGSKVFQQLNNLPDSSTMTDIMFVTKDPASWHEANFKKNKHHYSLPMRLIGPGGVSAVQNIQPYCLFNPYVEVEGVLLKYGVIAESHLLKDLQHWETLYIAGRLHKPVLILDQDPEFKMSYIRHNLRSALHLGLLLLPEKFSDLQLFSVISYISYKSDIRTKLKLENPQKVRNIVQPNIDHFRLLYKDVIDESPFIERTDYGYVQSAKTEKNVLLMEKLLPRKLLYLPDGNLNPKSRAFMFDKNLDPKHQLFRKIAASDSRYIDEQLRLIVLYPSIKQTLKGLLTAGVLKSLKYSRAKIRKSRGTKSVPAVVDASSTLMTAEYTKFKQEISYNDPVRWKNRILMILFGTAVLIHMSISSKSLQSFQEKQAATSGEVGGDGLGS